jgi:hypothetical protein
MTPEEWHDGMLNEAEHAPDPVWAAQTRGAAWRHARLLDVRSAMAWRTWIVPVLLILLGPATLSFVSTQIGTVHSGLGGVLISLFFVGLSVLYAPGMWMVLLMLWSVFWMLRGLATWLAASIAVLALILGPFTSWLTLLAFDQPVRLTNGATVEGLVSVLILVTFTVAFGHLKRIGERAATARDVR